MTNREPKRKHTGLARRRWRQVFRRTRIYIPFLLLVLVALGLFLPLSPGWLKNLAERRILEETGVAVRIERLRVQLALGQIDLMGIAVPGEGDSAPFHIDEVRLRGNFAELVAGDGRWPQSVEVVNPSEFRFVHRGNRVEPIGPLQSLLEAVGMVQARLGKGDDPGTEQETTPSDDPAKARSGIYLPSLRIQNVVLGIESETADFAPVLLNLTTLTVAERLGARDRIEVDYTGTATIVTAETISGTLFVNPATNSGRLETFLTGLRGDVNVPGHGEVAIDARNLLFTLGVVSLPENQFQINASVMANRFEVEERALGGVRWVDRDLELSLGVLLPGEMDRLSGLRLSLIGQETDIRLTGRMDLGEDLDGSMRLQIHTLPTAFLDVARREAALEGIVIDPLQNQVLRLDLELEGPFAQPALLSGVGSLELSNWEVSQLSWPSPLMVQHATGILTRESLHLPVIDVALGEMTGRVTATLPFNLLEPQDTHLEFEASLRGPTAEGLDFARHFGVLPREINRVSTLLAFDLGGRIPVRHLDGVYRVDERLAGAEFRGRLSWSEGDAEIRELPEPLRFSSGVLAFTEERASLEGLRVRYEDLNLNVDLALEREGGLVLGNPEAVLSLAVGGGVPSFIRLAEQLVPDLILPSDITGDIALRARAATRLPDWNEADYRLSLSLSNASGVLPLPDGPVALTKASLDMVFTPEEVRVDRLLARVADLADVSLTASVTEEKISVDFSTNADLGVVFAVAPYEVEDLVMEGRGNGRGTASLVPAEPLPDAPDIIRRWLAVLVGPEARRVDIEPGSPLRVVLNADITTDGPVSIFHREFPQPVRNIRGTATANERGFEFSNLRADIGSSRNVLIREGHVYLGILGRRVDIQFDVDIPEIDLNEWFEGWGEAPWAESPLVGPPRVRLRGPEPRHITRVILNLHVRGRTKFLSVHARQMTGTLIFDAWRNRHNALEVEISEAEMYGGKVVATGGVTFPEGSGLPTYQVITRAQGVQTQAFLSDLTGSPQEFVGLFDGIGEWGGTIGDYRDWEGVGEFTIRDSYFIGAQALVALSRALEFGNEERRTPSTISGTARMANERVVFENTVIENTRVRMVADGHAAFDDTIDFLITVDVLTNRLRNIPFLGQVVGVLNTLKDSLVSFRVGGTISDPQVNAAPLQLEKLPFFETSASLIGTAEARVSDQLRRAEQRLPRFGIPGTGSGVGSMGATADERQSRRGHPDDETRDSTEEERSGR